MFAVERLLLQGDPGDRQVASSAPHGILARVRNRLSDPPGRIITDPAELKRLDEIQDANW